MARGVPAILGNGTGGQVVAEQAHPYNWQCSDGALTS